MKRLFPFGAVLACLVGLLIALIFVSRSRHDASSSATSSVPAGLRGEVHGPGGPIVGARVRIKGMDISDLSDPVGRFRLLFDPDSGSRITAWKQGYLIGGADVDTEDFRLDLVPLPDSDNNAYEWVDPRPDRKEPLNCANCHAEIYREWSTGAHAHSATGRFFRDIYGSNDDDRPPEKKSWNLLAENPDGSGVCAACHAPTANLQETLDLRKVQGVAALGVHCDYCHKVTGAGLGEVGLTHGRHGMELLRPAQGQLFFGPLDDVDRGEDSFSPLYQQSKYCASCHEGTVFGVHVYSTYSEWLQSPAAKKGQQCQNCHMKPTGAMTNIAPGKGGIERQPGTLGNHLFFAKGKDEMLRQCLNLQVQVDKSGNKVEVRTGLAAEGAGHRVPTGFIDRHLILVVEALDGAFRPVRPEVGPTLPAAAGKELQDKPGWLYAKLLHAPKSAGPVPFWRPDHAINDTRLSPEQRDWLHWIFPADVAMVKISVIYRPFWQEVAQSKSWGNLDNVVRQETVPVPK